MAGSRIAGITIELDAKPTKLLDALKSVNKSIKDTQSQLRDVNKLLKVDPGNTELLKQKQELLSKSIEDTKKKLEQEKQALEQLKNSDGSEKTKQQQEALTREIIATEQQLEKLTKEYKEFGSVGQQQLKAVGGKMQEVGGKLKETGEKITAVGTSLTTKLTVPITAAFGSAIKVTADFDAQMSKVQAISGATAEDFDKLRDKAREMGSQTKYSATESAQAFEYMAMAGWKTEDMLNGISGIMNLAAASGEELGTTSDIVTDALTAFGMAAQDSARFADILASASSNANTNVSMMGESFKYVAPVAGSLGYSAEDIAIALGLMANSGIKASMAGTTLRNIFQNMSKPTDEVQAAMNRLGVSMQDDEGKMYSFREIMGQIRDGFSEINISVEDYEHELDVMDAALESGGLTQKQYNEHLEELNKQAFGAEGAEKARAAAMLGGARAMSGLLAIANASEADYEKLTQAIDNSSESFAKLADGSIVPLNEALASGAEVIATYNGQAELMAATMQDNLSGDVTTLKSMLEELAISFGDLLTPILREVVDGVKGIVGSFNNLDEGTKKTIATIAAVAAAVGPVIVVIGTVVSAVGTIISVVGSVVSAVSGAMGVISTVVSFLGGPVTIAIAAVVAAGVLLYKNWDTVKAVAIQLAQVVTQKFQEIYQKVSPILTAIGNAVKSAFDAIKNTVTSIMGAVGDLISTKLGNIKSAFDSAGGGITGVVSAVMTTIKEVWTTGLDLMNTLTGGALDGIKSKIDTGFEAARTTIVTAMNTITSAISSAWNAIMGVFKLPHFTVSGTLDLKSIPPKLPSLGIEWYAKAMHNGMILNKPTLFGAGEAGAEAIIGVNSLQSLIKGAVSESVTNYGGVNVTVYGAPGQSEEKLAEIISRRINSEVARKGAAWR